MAKQNKTKRPIWIEENLPAELANSTLFKFMVQLQVIESKNEETGKLTYKTIEVDMLPDLDLDYDMLEDQMMRLPAQYAYWAAIYSELKLAVAVAERKLKARKGRVIERITSEAAIAKVRLTVEQVKAIAEADSEIRDAELKYEKAQMTCGKIYHTIEALRIKAELARSLAGFKRQEQERS